jgi:hypothetical protein
MRIHEFEVPEPGEPTIEIKELNVTEYGEIATQAAKLNPLDVMSNTVHERKLQRLACIRGYGKLHVSNGDKPHDILVAMSVRAQDFLDLAFDHVHNIREAEAKPFFATQKTTEV